MSASTKPCPSCGGAGVVPLHDDREPLIGGKFCPVWFDNPTHTLNCIITGPHEGPHLTCDAPPCRGCGGMDLHLDDCPDIGMVTNEVINIHFDDEGRFWFPEPVDFANCFPYVPLGERSEVR